MRIAARRRGIDSAANGPAAVGCGEDDGEAERPCCAASPARRRPAWSAASPAGTSTPRRGSPPPTANPGRGRHASAAAARPDDLSASWPRPIGSFGPGPATPPLRLPYGKFGFGRTGWPGDGWAAPPRRRCSGGSASAAWAGHARPARRRGGTERPAGTARASASSHSSSRSSGSRPPGSGPAVPSLTRRQLLGEANGEERRRARRRTR